VLLKLNAILYIYGTISKGHSPEGEGYISHMAHDCHDIICITLCIFQGWGTCALLGSNRGRVLSVWVQDGKLYWCI